MPSKTAVCFLSLSFLVMVSTAAAATLDKNVFHGTSRDERVEGCGIIMTGDTFIQIEPFMKGKNHIEGQLLLDVSKIDASGTSQSQQIVQITDGTLGKTMVTTERTSVLSVALTAIGKSGEILCEMQQTISHDSGSTRI